MIQTLLTEELKRVLDKLNETTPGTEEYSDLLKDAERLQKLVIDDDKQGEAQLRRRHESEMDEKKVEIEQMKLTLEMLRIQSEDKKAERHDELEREKNANEAARLDIDKDRLEFEKEESKEKLENEAYKLAIEEMEVGERVHYTKKQAIWGLVGDLARVSTLGVVDMLLINKIGGIQQFGILDKTQMSLVPKIGIK